VIGPSGPIQQDWRRLAHPGSTQRRCPGLCSRARGSLCHPCVTKPPTSTLGSQHRRGERPPSSERGAAEQIIAISTAEPSRGSPTGRRRQNAHPPGHTAHNPHPPGHTASSDCADRNPQVPSTSDTPSVPLLAQRAAARGPPGRVCQLFVTDLSHEKWVDEQSSSPDGKDSTARVRAALMAELPCVSELAHRWKPIPVRGAEPVTPTRRTGAGGHAAIHHPFRRLSSLALGPALKRNGAGRRGDVRTARRVSASALVSRGTGHHTGTPNQPQRPTNPSARPTSAPNLDHPRHRPIER